MTHLRRLLNRPAATLAVAAATLLSWACSESTPIPSSPRSTASQTGPDYAAQFDATAKPMFTTDGGVTPFRTSRTIAYWSSSFTDPTNGATYPYTMVGTNPFTGNGQTTVPTTIIPFRFIFADGTVMDGGGDVAAVLASPIFSEYAYPLSRHDRTQYADAIQRAQFNKIGTSYHVLLGAPTIQPTQTFDVPANQGFAFINSRGVLVALMDISWFSNKLHNAINTLQVSSTTTPIVLTHNTLTWIGNVSVCCVLGYHGATSSLNGNGDQQVQTYIYSAFITPRTYAFFDQPGRGLGDIHALSHEVSEFYDDPFVNNIVNPWLTPTAPQYGCTAYLETGDPVVGFWFPLPGNPQPNANGVWHPEDEVYFSWFARQTPSIAYKGLYTYMGTFTRPAIGC